MSVHDRCFSGVGFEPSNLAELLRWRASHFGSQRAYTFLAEEGGKEIQVTFGELDLRARKIAGWLQSLGMTGERALLIYPPGIHYITAFFGCIYAGTVAVPAYPPDPTRLGRTLPRLQAIADDCRAKVVLTTTAILAMMKMVKTGRRIVQSIERLPLVGRRVSGKLTRLLAQTALDPFLDDPSPLPWLSTDKIDEGFAEKWQAAGITKETIAFLQYTSGSTAAPRGVMLSHENLLHNLGLINHAFEVDPDFEGVIWLPTYHDMGLIGGVMQPLYAGFPCTLMSPIAFLKRPLRWLQAISRIQGRAVVSGGPNFAYDLCIRKVSAEQKSALDLTNWEVAFSGAEPVRPQTIDRFFETFRTCGFRRETFYPCYGLAEATLIVSGSRRKTPPVFFRARKSALARHRVYEAKPDQTDSVVLVGCGRSLLNQKIAIVEPRTMQECPPGQVGEIWVSGPSVAKGYFERTEETQQTFHARLKGSGETPFLRTGDLGFLREGELFITGRTKDVIIIRGRNHHPQDIEQTVEESHPSLRKGCSAAFSTEIAGEERLVVAQEVSGNRPLDAEEIVGAIRRAVAEEHDLAVHTVVLLKPRSIPKTSSGKIQRHACRAMFLNGSLEVVKSSTMESIEPLAEETPAREPNLLAKALASLEGEKRRALLESFLQEHLGRILKVTPSQLDPKKPLTEWGVDSVLAVDLVSELESTLGVSLEIERLIQGVTISEVASQVLEKLIAPGSAGAAPSEAGRARDRKSSIEFPLSFGQRAMWFLQQLSPSSVAHNVVHAVQIRPDTDLAALRQAFQRLADRHPALRTSFDSHQGEPVQRVQDHAEIRFEIQDGSGWSESLLDEHLAAEIYRPFELGEAPLCRPFVFLRGSRNAILLLAMHHIITDLWSMAILLSELPRLYQEEVTTVSALLPAPGRWTYADHVREETEMLSSPEGERLWAYWQSQLRGDLPVLDLPTDRPRPPVQSDRGAARYFSFNPELTGSLKSLAEAHGTNLFTLMLAAFQTLLHRDTGQEVILVGSPKFGRNRRMARTLGYFINSVVLRADFGGNPPFTQFLEQMHETVRGAFQHDAFPFPLLVERLAPIRELSHSPIFQVMFAWQKTTSMVDNHVMASFALGEEHSKATSGQLIQGPVFLKQRATPFDLALWVVEGLSEGQNRLRCTMEYKTDLFDPQTIDRMLAHLHVLLWSIVTHPQERIGDLPLLTQEEKRPLHATGPKSVQKELSGKPVHRLFEAQAERTPDSIALVDGNRCLTYRSLNLLANRLGALLLRAGATPESRVGVLLDRSLESVISLFGILKAGCAYLPLDPASPPERLRYMIEDSGVRVILTQSTFRDQRSEVRGQTGRNEEGKKGGRRKAESGILDPGPWTLDLGPGTLDRGPLPPTSNLQPPTMICLDTDWEKIAKGPDEDPRVAVDPDNLAYVIYTSGSTGLPKGVLISHGAFSEHCLEIQNHYRLTPGDRVLQFASLVFDASLEQIVPPLITGSRVVLMHGDLWAPKDFRRKVSDLGLTIINLPPAYWSQVVLLWDQEKDPVQSLRLVIIGGDVVRPKSIEVLAGTSMNTARILNAYGPTETTITATTFEIPSDPAELLSMSRVPIGEPLSGRKGCIVDKYGNPVPAGLTGELCLGGVGIARGYLNRPELTAEKFVPDPFVEISNFKLQISDPTSHLLTFSTSDFGGRLYRTGDLARSLPRGGIDFLGRIDHQVKVRGFRVELGEIETALRKHPGVKDALLLSEDREDAGGQRLVACVVFEPGGAPSGEDLRRYLQGKLPSYMIPASFVSLERFPMTAGGKIDRVALLKMQGDVLKPQTERIFPRNPVERQLAEIWSELLGVRVIAVNDNFFALGGHSLIATQIVARIRDIYGVEIPLRRVFESPTVADLASAIAEAMAEQEEESNLDSLLSEVEALSREKASAMLGEAQADFIASTPGHGGKTS